MAYEKQTWVDKSTTTPLNAKRLNYIEEGIFSTSTTADTALANSTSAIETADIAKTTADTAITNAAEAKTTAETAQSTATSAKSIAEGIESIAKSARDTADNAKTIAEGISGKADSAIETANEASDKANSAQESADEAKILANNAQSTANESLVKANAAQTLANLAKTTANEAKTAANLAQTAADTAAIKADTALAKATKVEANPELSGEETDLTSIKIEDTKYKLGNGLPEGTATGNALIYKDGAWTQQEGYGYVETLHESTSVSYDWDGSTTGKESVDIIIDEDTFTLYKVADAVPMWDEGTAGLICRAGLLGGFLSKINSKLAKKLSEKIVTSSTDVGYIIMEGDNTTYTNANVGIFEGIPFIVYAKEGGATILGANFTKGLWFLNAPNWGTYITQLTINPEVISWDGDITGRPSVVVGESTIYQISSEVSNLFLSEITQNNFWNKWGATSSDNSTYFVDACENVVSMGDTAAIAIIEIYKSSSENSTHYYEGIVFVKEDTTYESITVPAGIWVTKSNSDFYIKSVALNFDDIENIYKIDSKYISDLKNINATGYFSLNRASGSTIGRDSFTEGYSTVASGEESHAEGYNTVASGSDSHAEGSDTTAEGFCSHAEGSDTTAEGFCSHAEGSSTTASESVSHAEGQSTRAIGYASHAQNSYTIASKQSATAIGEYNIDDTQGSAYQKGKYAFMIGNGTSNEARSNAFTVDWSGNVNAAGNIQATGLTDGTTTKTMTEILAGGGGSSSDKMDKTNPTGTGSFSLNRKADSTIGNNSFAEGTNCEANGANAHAEGFMTHAQNYHAHSEGSYNYASGYSSHAEGDNTMAIGRYSHTQNYCTRAYSQSQTVIGENNIIDNTGSATTRGTYALIIGNGTNSSTDRSNALTVDWSGNLVCRNIPAPPTTDGNYILKCTVSGGTATYNWVQE